MKMAPQIEEAGKRKRKRRSKREEGKAQKKERARERKGVGEKEQPWKLDHRFRHIMRGIPFALYKLSGFLQPQTYECWNGEIYELSKYG